MASIKIKCPYCGTKQEVKFNPQFPNGEKETIYCDIDEINGCDELFVYQISLKPNIEYWKTEIHKEDLPF